MADLKVTDTTVPGVLDYLRKGEWLVPEFQREFVWSTEQVSSLVQSILEARPIGMVTLWEQGEQDQAPLERLSIPDYDPNTKQTTLQSFGEKDVVATKRYALWMAGSVAQQSQWHLVDSGLPMDSTNTQADTI